MLASSVPLGTLTLLVHWTKDLVNVVTNLSGGICDNMTGQVSIALGHCMTYSNIAGEQQLVVG